MTATRPRWTELGEWLDRQRGLDAFAIPAQGAVRRAIPDGSTKDTLTGKWLGHPLHPLLTDLPIGFWTSSFMLDFVGGRRGANASRTLVGLGVLSAAPTVAAGLADWSDMRDPARRAGLVHAAANASATVMYAMSYWQRRRGHHLKGIAWGLAGATAATAGGLLGGYLAFPPDPADAIRGNSHGDPVRVASSL